MTLLPIENGWKDSGTLDLYIQEFNLPIPMRTLWAKQINIRMGKQSDLGAQAMRPDGMNASSCRCVVADQVSCVCVCVFIGLIKCKLAHFTTSSAMCMDAQP